MIYLIDYVSVIFNQLAAAYLFGKMISKKLLINLEFSIKILLFGALQIFLSVNGYKTVCTILTIIFFVMLFKKTYNCSWTESKNYCIIIWSVSIILDIVFMVIMNMLKIGKEQGSFTLLIQGISSIIMSLVIFALAKTPKFIKLTRTIYKRIMVIKLSKITLLITAYIFLLIGFISYQNMEDRKTMIIIIFIIITIIFIIWKLVSLKYQLMTLLKTNNYLEKNEESNKKIIMNYRIIKHNIESQLLGVKCVANKEAKELLEIIIKEYSNSFYTRHEINDLPMGLSGLFVEKLYNYKDENIRIIIENKITSNILQEIGPKNYNIFCEALGVLFDNAIEAANISDEKIIHIYFGENSNEIISTIKNTFKGSVDICRLGKVYYTSKSEGHGLGLFSLINKKNLDIKTTIKDNLFINRVTIKKMN